MADPLARSERRALLSKRDLERIRASVDAAPKFTPEQVARLRAIVHGAAAGPFPARESA